MRQQLKRSFLICAVTAFCSGGCAKHELVKQDQMIPPAASSASSALPANSAVTAQLKPETKDAGLSVPPIDESQAKKQAQPTVTPQDTNLSLNAALEKVFFDFDSYTLSPQAREALAKNAEIMKQKGNAGIRIEGHCDELGSDDYNLALGEKRARVALNYLQSMGVSSGRLSAISYGKEKPADPGHDEAGRAKNRRDEFVMTLK
jgi:peptidoglycan-associated lipoprotein